MKYNSQNAATQNVSSNVFIFYAAKQMSKGTLAQWFSNLHSIYLIYSSASTLGHKEIKLLSAE